MNKRGPQKKSCVVAKFMNLCVLLADFMRYRAGQGALPINIIKGLCGFNNTRAVTELLSLFA